MRKLMIVILGLLAAGILRAGKIEKMTLQVKGYRLTLSSLEAFDYNKRFEGRKVLGSERVRPCLKGTLIFNTALKDVPVGVKPTCVIDEALTNRDLSLVINVEDDEDFRPNLSNRGRAVFYLEPPGKKDKVIERLSGKIIFKVPVRSGEKRISDIHTSQWLTIPGGKLSVIVLEGPDEHRVYAVVRYPRKGRGSVRPIKIYLLDIETEEKSAFWKYNSFTAKNGDLYVIYKADFYIEGTEDLYLAVNDRDYHLNKLKGPPFPKITDINVFLLNSQGNEKYKDQVYFITLPPGRARKYNWTYLNINDKSLRFSLKKKERFGAVKKYVILKEFTRIPAKGAVRHMGIFQAEKYLKKMVPFTFGPIALK